MGSTAGHIWSALTYPTREVIKGAKGVINSVTPGNSPTPEPPVLPNPPDVKTQQAAAGIAMTNAALAARRMAKGSGLASTILTSPTGAPAAPTAVKTLLGT